MLLHTASSLKLGVPVAHSLISGGIDYNIHYMVLIKLKPEYRIYSIKLRGVSLKLDLVDPGYLKQGYLSSFLSSLFLLLNTLSSLHLQQYTAKTQVKQE